MSVSINFELPPGTATSVRQFPSNTLMKVWGNVDFGGLPVIDCRVEISITGNPYSAFSPMYYSTTTTIAGNYEWVFTTPNVNAQATVKVTAYYFPASNGDSNSLPISFGTTLPGQLPTPVSWTKVLMWTGIGVGALIGGVAIYKLASSHKPEEILLLPPGRG